VETGSFDFLDWNSSKSAISSTGVPSSSRRSMRGLSHRSQLSISYFSAPAVPSSWPAPPAFITPSLTV
jgi:hypothetical protein